MALNFCNCYCTLAPSTLGEDRTIQHLMINLASFFACRILKWAWEGRWEPETHNRSECNFPNPTVCIPKFLNLRFSWRRTENTKFMLHKIFTGSVILVWRVQRQVRYLASIKAGKSLNLHHAYQASSLNELSFARSNWYYGLGIRKKSIRNLY